MARKITLFELYFDGIQFGSRGDEEADADKPAFDPVEADDETSGRSRVRPALAVMGTLAVVSAAGVMAFRRFRGGADEEFEFDEHEYETDDYESVGHVEDREATLD